MLLQARLVVEQVKLARRTSHEQVDDVFDLRRKVRKLGAVALSGVSVAPANSRSLTSDASAIVPKPVPHSLKKWRRVIAARISELNAIVVGGISNRDSIVLETF